MEPERRIEKLLRAFAKKRRDRAGAALELRPDVRQRLQQEISRRSTTKSGSGFLSNLFLALRPRLAFALCSMAILCIGGWFLLATLAKKIGSSQLASANSPSAKISPRELSRPMPALTPPSPPAPVIASSHEDKRRADSAGAAVRSLQPSGAPANAPAIISHTETVKQINVTKYDLLQTNSAAGITVASVPTPASTFSKTEGTASDSFGISGTLNKDVPDRTPQPVAPPVETAPAPVVAPTLASRDQEKKLETQKQPIYAAAPSSAAMYDSAGFKAAAEPVVAVQVYNNSLNIAADGKRALGLVSVPAPVLNSFRLEQNGRELRVVDSDGSVYTGVVQVVKVDNAVPATFGGSPKSKPSAAPPMKTSPQSAAQNYFFSVAGTNRNLNQNVVFSGNLIPLTNFPVLRSNAGAVGGALRTGRPATTTPQPSVLSNSRISGMAVIGNQKEIEVNATPAP